MKIKKEFTTRSRFETTTDLIDHIESTSAHILFNSWADLMGDTSEHFQALTQDFDIDYAKSFGLERGGFFTREVGVMVYFLEETNHSVTVKFYEAFIDSADPDQYYYVAYSPEI